MVLDMDKSSEHFGNLSKRVALLALTTRNVSSDEDLPPNQVLAHHASRLDKLALLLKEGQREVELENSELVEQSWSEMESEVIVEEELMEFYACRSSLYLLMACPYLVKRLRNSCFIFSQALGSIFKHGCSPSLEQQLAETQKLFEEEAPKLGVKEQQLVDCFETGVLDTVMHHDSQSIKLAEQIAECLGAALGSDAFRNELAKLQAEKGTAEEREGRAHAMILDQYINLLEKAVTERSYPGTPVHPGPPRKLMTLKETPFLPLQSFICPITKDVMKDPVQIASGQTYERSAIERWFAAGHTRCPLGVELKNTKMKSNFALRQSIAEWRERNWNIRMQIAEAALSSENLEEKIKAVQDMQALCEEDSINRYTISSKGLLPPLVQLAESKDIDLRIKTISTLRSLAQDNDEIQEIMVQEGVIDRIVRSLARHRDEAKEGILLLLVLSAKSTYAELISQAQGAVLLLVTLLSSEEGHVADNVKAILENLPTSDENVIIMAEANLLTPLVARLVEGKTQSRILMAKTLARLHIPDTSKQNLATHDAISILTQMMASVSKEESESAINALESLSCVASVAELVSGAGALYILKNKLSFPRSSVEVKTGVSNILANILAAWGSNMKPDADSEAELDNMVCTCLSLLSQPLTPPTVQSNLLRGLLGISRGRRSRKIGRSKMVQQQAFSVLVPLLRSNVVPEVISYAVQLFASLSSSYSSEAGTAVKEKQESIKCLMDVLQKDSGRNDEEQLAVVRIMANLPLQDAEITGLLGTGNAVQLLVRLLGSNHGALEEAVVGALLRFTTPDNVERQRKLASLGVIPKFVSLLDSGKPLAKERAARALANFSKSSCILSQRVAAPKWWACFSPIPQTCRLHSGVCSVEGSFCLLQAEAISPLLSVLKEGEKASSEAALAALDTLVDETIENWEHGVHLIARAKGVPLIFKFVSCGTPAAQELSLKLVHQIFTLTVYKEEHGSAAQMHIITVAQQGSPKKRHMAGQILRQLDLLHSQSHYFAQSQSTG